MGLRLANELVECEGGAGGVWRRREDEELGEVGGLPDLQTAQGRGIAYIENVYNYNAIDMKDCVNLVPPERTRSSAHLCLVWTGSRIWVILFTAPSHMSGSVPGSTFPPPPTSVTLPSHPQTPLEALPLDMTARARSWPPETHARAPAAPDAPLV